MSAETDLVFLTSRYPYPLDKGDRIRAFHQVRELGKFFRVHVICLSESLPQPELLRPVAEMCYSLHVFPISRWKRRLRMVKAVFSNLPLQVAYFDDPHVRRQIQFLIKRISPDHVHCHLVRMVPYLPTSGPWLTSIDYMDSLVLNDLAAHHLKTGLLRVFLAKERKDIKRYETIVSDSSDHHFVISDRDRLCFEAPIRERLTLLPNGIDLDYFQFQEESEAIYHVVFCGNLGYAPNLKAALYLRDVIAARLQDVTFLIAGAQARSSLLNHSLANVTVMGRQEDIRHSYRSGAIFVAPLWEGSGQQNKILEAMALGTPVVTTSHVNAGIGADPASDLLIADDTDEFIRQINQLLSRPHQRLTIKRKARQFVEDNFNWSVNTTPLVEVIS